MTEQRFGPAVGVDSVEGPANQQGDAADNRPPFRHVVVLVRLVIVANDIAGIAAVFPDHALIKSLGCESVINVPIVIGGEVLGTINCLHVAGFYTEEKVAASEGLKLPGAVCVLLDERDARGGA